MGNMLIEINIYFIPTYYSCYYYYVPSSSSGLFKQLDCLRFPQISAIFLESQMLMTHIHHDNALRIK